MNNQRLLSDGPIFLWIIVDRHGRPFRSASDATRKDAINKIENHSGERWRTLYRKYGFRAVKLVGRVLPRFGGHYDFDKNN